MTDPDVILLLDRLGLGSIAGSLRAASASDALTPLALFSRADPLVQAVMLGLLAASVLAWAIWAGKLVQLTLARRALARDYRMLAAAGRLGAPLSKGLMARMQAAALAEIRASEGQHVVAGVVHQGAELGLLLAQGVSHDLPLGFGLGLGLLCEDRLQHRRHRGALLGRGVSQGVAHPVNAAPLMGRIEDTARGRPQALVVVGDHQLHAAQAPIGEAAQELGPERLGLGGAGGDAQNLALAVVVHGDGDYHRSADDPPALAHLHIGRVEPEVGPCALKRSGQEGVHPLVDLGAEAADLALGHAACAHRLDEVINRPCRDAMDVGLLDHRHEGLLRRATRLKEAREIAALPEPGDLQRDPACPGIPVAVAVSVALNLPHRRSRALGRARPGFHLILRYDRSTGSIAARSNSMIRSAAKASISRTRSPSAFFSTSSISAILSSVIVISVVGSRSRNPNILRRSAVTASVTHGRALRYAGGSARGLLHHHPGHSPRSWRWLPG